MKNDKSPKQSLGHRVEVAMRRAKLKPRKEVPGRRQFLAGGIGAVGGGLLMGTGMSREGAATLENAQSPVRPPTGGTDEERFQQACIRCGLCGLVCENGCIRFFGLDEPEAGRLTPYIDVRRRSCTLCMRCTQVCPTNALQPVEDTPEAIVAAVDMGVAVVDPDRCLSYLGRICGYCHDACPIPNIAIRLTPPAKPVIIEENCVGCGRCVEECPQGPTAIEVVTR